MAKITTKVNHHTVTSVSTTSSTSTTVSPASYPRTLLNEKILFEKYNWSVELWTGYDGDTSIVVGAPYEYNSNVGRRGYWKEYLTMDRSQPAYDGLVMQELLSRGCPQEVFEKAHHFDKMKRLLK